MKIKTVLLALISTTFTLGATASIVDTVMPGSHNNGTWLYDGTFNNQGVKGPVQAGMFVSQLNDYNKKANTNSQINQVFSYGGDIEMYCDGGEGGEDTNACTYNSLLLGYYPPSIVNKKMDGPVSSIIAKLGDSGFSTVNQYAQVKQSNGSSVQTIVDIDGRVDMPASEDYLNELNTMPQVDANQFADKVAAQICADDGVSGIQFDVEPFSFIGSGDNAKPGPGQKYFYQEIAKDLAGNYSGNNWPNPTAANDPLHCVDAAHPVGRVFSVFTFAKGIAEDPQEIQQVFGKGSYGNGYVIDSLYDVATNEPGGTWTAPNDYKGLALTEASTFKAEADKLGIPYQFAIPAAASTHEFESKAGVATGANQDEYVTAVLDNINSISARQDPLFKGVDLWGWVSAMWWGGDLYTPATPAEDKNGLVLSDLEQNLGGS